MKQIDAYFIVLAAVSLIVGVVLGITMAGSHEFQLLPVHAHVNLVGWASLALFGLTYRSYPELKTGKLALLHLVFGASGAILLPIGIYFAVVKQSETLATVSSLLWLAAVVLFAVQALRLLKLTRPGGTGERL
jgi:hypothetical protein